MRNYIKLIMTEVYFSVDDISFQRKVYAAANLLDCNAQIAATLAILQNFDPSYHVYQQTDYLGIPQDGPGAYYFKLSKPNLLTTMQSVVVFDNVAASIWGCADFAVTFTRESPRKTWSHNH